MVFLLRYLSSKKRVLKYNVRLIRKYVVVAPGINGASTQAANMYEETYLHDLDPFTSILFRKKNTKYKLGKILKPIYSSASNKLFSENQLLELKQLGVELDKTPPAFVNKYQANVSFLKSIKDGFLITHDNLPSETLV